MHIHDQNNKALKAYLSVTSKNIFIISTTKRRRFLLSSYKSQQKRNMWTAQNLQSNIFEQIVPFYIFFSALQSSFIGFDIMHSMTFHYYEPMSFIISHHKSDFIQLKCLIVSFSSVGWKTFCVEQPFRFCVQRKKVKSVKST